MSTECFKVQQCSSGIISTIKLCMNIYNSPKNVILLITLIIIILDLQPKLIYRSFTVVLKSGTNSNSLESDTWRWSGSRMSQSTGSTHDISGRSTHRRFYVLLVRLNSTVYLSHSTYSDTNSPSLPANLYSPAAAASVSQS